MLVNFACYFPAEQPRFIVIEIKPDAWVQQILEVIAVKLKEEHKDLRLFKTDISLEPEETLQLRALQWLHQQPANSQLRETTKLSLVFPNGPHQSDDDLKLDIIISDGEVVEMIEGLGDPYDAYKRKVKKDLNERVKHLSPAPSPSEVVGSPAKLADVFGCDNPNIHLVGGAPAMIFNRVLATLQQRLNHLEQIEVSRPEVDRAARYLRCAVKFYRDEKERETSIKQLLDEAIGKAGEWRCPFEVNSGSKIIPDGCWYLDMFLILFLELKNTLGLGGDALCQAVVDYSKICSRDQYRPFREYCNFPIVLVGITANRLEISVAVCVGPIYVTKLLTLDLSLGFHASDNMIRLARVFSALSSCRVDLENYYNDVKNLSSPRLSCLFPDPTPIDSSKPLPKLTYRQFLSRTGQPTSALVDLGNAATTMYIATFDDDTNQEVIVKFTARYNEVAHRLLAEARLAPRLHFCGRVVGDLYMIVMDRVDGKSIWQLREDKAPIPAIVTAKVEEAVSLLHDKDIVFGDLRSNNILYVASERRVVLVDFDWPGKNGESRYPVTLNPGELGKAWAETVLPYGIMHKTDDLWQLDRLKDLCTKSNV